MNPKIRIGRIKEVSNGKITYTDPFLINVTYTTSILNIIQRLNKGFSNSSVYFIDTINKSILTKIGDDGDNLIDVQIVIKNHEQNCSFMFFIPHYERLLISNCGTLIGNGYLKSFAKPIFGVYEHIPLNTGEIGYLILHTDGTLLFVLY